LLKIRLNPRFQLVAVLAWGKKLDAEPDFASVMKLT
jgi:hypothetical protein